MSDASEGESPENRTGESPPESEANTETGDVDPRNGDDEPSLAELRERVEEEYDFEDFRPADMAEMSAREWRAAFDPETWITGTELLDRVEADLKRKVADRQVFAVVERLDDPEDRVLAYSEESYAVVFPDGTVEGEGMVLREVKPLVALCSMEDYDPGPMPEGDVLLPRPEEIEPGSGSLGDLVMQALAGIQLLAGVFLIAAPFLFDLGGDGAAFLTGVLGLGFVVIGIVLFVLVANARLSDRFRAAEYRDRLDAVGVGSGERPDFVPIGSDEPAGDEGADSAVANGPDGEGS